MRAKTQVAIDALYAKIADLVAKEKVHHDRGHPGENSLLRQIAHTAIDAAAMPPTARAQMVWATASFPRVGGARAKAAA
jgi:hypothetical protein